MSDKWRASVGYTVWVCGKDCPDRQLVQASGMDTMRAYALRREEWEGAQWRIVRLSEEIVRLKEENELLRCVARIVMSAFPVESVERHSKQAAALALLSAMFYGSTPAEEKEGDNE